MGCFHELYQRLLDQRPKLGRKDTKPRHQDLKTENMQHQDSKIKKIQH